MFAYLNRMRTRLRKETAVISAFLFQIWFAKVKGQNNLYVGIEILNIAGNESFIKSLLFSCFYISTDNHDPTPLVVKKNVSKKASVRP